MINNYLTIAWRSLVNKKSVTVIHILGLSIGLCGCLLVGTYLMNEMQYDRHFDFHDRTYRLISTRVNTGSVSHSAQTTADIAKILRDQFPEIQSTARVLPADEGFIFLNEVAFKEEIFYTDSSFASLFDLSMLVGKRSKCLADPSSIIISRQMAVRLFGEDWIKKAVIDATLLVDKQIPLTITGVFEDLPAQTHFKSNLFASIPSGHENWLTDQSKVTTYLLLKENTNSELLTKKIESASLLSGDTNDGQLKLQIQSIADVHLFSNFENDNAILGNLRNMVALALVAAFLLFIAVANFANLFAASSLIRLKEVGVRKALGARTGQVRNQLLLETFLITAMALIVGLLMTVSFLPSFNAIISSELSLTSWMSWEVVLSILVLTIGVSLLAGLYPSMYLSVTRAADALKAKRGKAGMSMTWRKCLVIIQFSISCVAIILSIVAYRQVSLINNESLGFDKENTIVLSNPYMLGNEGKIILFKNELLQIPGVTHATITGYTPSQNRWGRSRVTFPKRNPNGTHVQTANWLTVDEGFINTMGLTLLEGRNFRENHDSEKASVIINERAAMQFGLALNGANPIGSDLSFTREDKTIENYQVIGVVKDFNFGSLHEAIKPVVMEVGYHRFEMALRLSPSYSSAEIIGQVGEAWKKNLPNVPFEFNFIKDRFAALHQSDMAASKLFSILCAVMVVLSALGLLSVVTFIISNRIKEIGVRKVLGASTANIVLMLASQFVTLVSISFVLALPISWGLSMKWLDDFAYKTTLSVWIFLTAAVAVLLITFIVLFYQTLKAATSNPIDQLRSE